MSRYLRESRQYQLQSISSFTDQNRISIANGLQIEYLTTHFVEIEDLNQDIQLNQLI
jgi:hypothetical protein